MSRRLFYFLSYFGKPPWDSGIVPPELEAFLRQHQPGHALDLGCGTGTNAIALKQHGWTVTGIDFTPKAIRMARHKAQQAGLEIDFRVGDVSQIKNLPGPFDLVLDIGCFHNLAARAKQDYVKNLSQWLAKDGAFLLYGFLAADHHTAPGIRESDIALFSTLFRCSSRTDSTDRGRRSTWLLFFAASGNHEQHPVQVLGTHL